ncbi:MAG: aminotransferase class V-fold PLP-dependent enzyme, partial [Chloroflexi bacterium]
MRRSHTGARGTCSWSSARSEARPGQAAAPARSTCAARCPWGAAGASHEEDARGEAPRHVWDLPQVRRDRVVPALELPHHGRVAAVPLLRAEPHVTPAEARSMFPVLERSAYLNAGSVGPLSRHTFEAMQAAEAAALAGGRGAASVWEAAFATEEKLRERIAAQIGVSVDKLLLTTSTTEGCNIVVTGLRLSPEDEVVTTDGEHPGLLMPLLASGAQIKKARVMERPAALALQAVLDEITPRTRLVALSHVLWLNGHVLPLADIKRETGLPLLVDGAQSVGAIPVDAAVADWYTVSGQKWL